jgi:hypothetical protein
MIQDQSEQLSGDSGLDVTTVTDPIRNRCQMEVFDQGQQPLDNIANEILSIHYSVFPNLLDPYRRSPEDTPADIERKHTIFEFNRKSRMREITRLISDPESCLVLCKDGETGKYVGYSLAVPVGLSDPQRKAESNETAYIFNTGFVPNYQGHKLVGDIMPILESSLRNKGYKFVERDVRMENGYHLKVEKNYGSRIIGKTGPHKSKFGPQMFYRIAL